jgi:hypothetical protein
VYRPKVKLTFVLFSLNYQQMNESNADHLNANDDDEESDSSDDNSSYRDDGDSSDEDEPEVKSLQVRRELEWDDSTLNF